ncbi:hypothetical protein Ancab_022108 [Ancistrocladus abbreviatus]
MPIGELFLGAFRQVLFDRIASKPVLDFFQHDGHYKSRLSYLEIVLLMLEPNLPSSMEPEPKSQPWGVVVRNFVFSPFNSVEKEVASRLDEIIQMLDNMASQIPILGLTVTRSTLEKVTGEPRNLHSLETLQVELSDRLRGRKFLVVLDDVWSKRVED